MTCCNLDDSKAQQDNMSDLSRVNQSNGGRRKVPRKYRHWQRAGDMEQKREGWTPVVHAESGNTRKKRRSNLALAPNSRLHSIALFCAYDRRADCADTVRIRLALANMCRLGGEYFPVFRLVNANNA